MSTTDSAVEDGSSDTAGSKVDLTTSGEGHHVPTPHAAHITGEQASGFFEIQEEEKVPSHRPGQVEDVKEQVKRYAASPAEAAAALASMGATSEQASTAKAPGSDELTDDLRALYVNLQKCLDLRDKYMDVSLQGKWQDNPRNWDAEYCEKWDKENGRGSQSRDIREKECGTIKVDGSALCSDGVTPKPWRVYPAPPRPHWEHFEPAPQSSFVVRPTSVNPLPPAIPPASPANAKAAQALLEATGRRPGVFSMEHVSIPGRHQVKGQNVSWAMDESGVCQVWMEEDKKQLGQQEPQAQANGFTPKPLFRIPSIREYFRDLDYLLSVISDGPTKSFAWRRLKYLDGKWNLYILLNEYRELADMKRVPHRCVSPSTTLFRARLLILKLFLQRLLQRQESGHTRSSQRVDEPEALAPLHQGEDQAFPR